MLCLKGSNERLKTHATTQRRNEKLKKKSMTENEIHKQVMDATFLILLKHGFKRVVSRL